MGLLKTVGKVFKKATKAVSDPFGFIGDLVSTGAGLIGSKSQVNAQENANATNVALARETNAQNAALQREANSQNLLIHNQTMQAQEAAARHAIQWRMEDAQAAGIHPLYAMGNPGISIGPSGVQMEAASMLAPQVSAVDRGGTLAQMGQGVGRAVAKMQTKEQRVAAANARMRQDQMDALTIEGKHLDNEFTRAQIAALQSKDQVGPPAPSVTGSVSGARPGKVVMKPSEPIVGSPGYPGREPGIIQSYRYNDNNDGTISIMPSADMKQAMEDSTILEADWLLRNRILPAVRGLKPPSPREYPLPRGFKSWKWNPWKQAFEPSRSY